MSDKPYYLKAAGKPVSVSKFESDYRNAQRMALADHVYAASEKEPDNDALPALFIQNLEEAAQERDQYKAHAERLAEVLEDITDHTVNAQSYPDGPCIDAEYRDAGIAALAAWKAREQQ